MLNWCIGMSSTVMVLEGRVFGLDAQLVADVLIQAIAIFLLFAFLSCVLFEPVMKVLKNRTERIQNDIESAKKDKEDAAKLKEEYDSKIQSADTEVQEILSEARKKAKKRENEIIDEANVEATRVKDRATQEIELEKAKAQDEIRQEIIQVATAMAAKIVSVSLSEEQQNALLEETLKEMGDETWLSK